jgi:alkyl hydroperoxide reductase subunit F
MYDLIIIGGGPAGVAAGVYAARKKMKTLLLAESFGGQSLVSADVQNWIGTKSVSGFDLAQMLEGHLRAQEDIEILDGDLASGIEKKDGGFVVKTRDGKSLETKYIFLASGSRRRRLGVPGEDKFEGKGVVYCSICDAPLFKDKTVAVVGGGNAGLEAVIDLLPYAKKIYLIVRSGALKGDAVTQEKVATHQNVEVIYNATTTEIAGGEFVTGLRYLDMAAGGAGAPKELALDGVFVEIGAVPNSEFVKGLVDMNERGEVIVDHRTQQSSLPGIWAAGDVSDVRYKQNNISAGDAVKAILHIYETMVKTAKGK